MDAPENIGKFRLTALPRQKDGYYRGPGLLSESFKASEEEMLALERELEEKHGIALFEYAFPGGSTALVLKSGDKVVHLRNRNIEVAEYGVANPTLAQGKVGENIYYAISPYRPLEVTESALFAALQASLFAEAGVLYTDFKIENVSAEIADIIVTDETGEQKTRTVKMPWIIDVEKAYFEKPYWDDIDSGLEPSHLTYFREGWNAGEAMPYPVVVRTASHEVFFFSDSAFYQAFQDISGKEKTYFETKILDLRRLKIGEDFAPIKETMHKLPLYALAVKNPEITIAHHETGKTVEFSLRLLMEEAIRLREGKQR